MSEVQTSPVHVSSASAVSAKPTSARTSPVSLCETAVLKHPSSPAVTPRYSHAQHDVWLSPKGDTPYFKGELVEDSVSHVTSVYVDSAQPADARTPHTSHCEYGDAPQGGLASGGECDDVLDEIFENFDDASVDNAAFEPCPLELLLDNAESVQSPCLEDKNADNVTPADELRPRDNSVMQVLDKFKTPESLAKAYLNLESAFTQKAMRVRELEERAHGLTSPVSQSEFSDAPQGGLASGGEEPKKTPSRGEIIQEYLKAIAAKQQQPAVITTSQDFVFGSVPEAKSLRDVAKIAESYFKNKENLK